MELEELEEALKNLKFEQNCIMKLFYQNLQIKMYGVASELFSKLIELQSLINEYERCIAHEKGIGFVNKFGKIVYSEEDLEYWNQLHEEVFPPKEKNIARKI